MDGAKFWITIILKKRSFKDWKRK